MTEFPNELRTLITDLASAKAWIECLRNHDMTWHLDDCLDVNEEIRHGDMIVAKADVIALEANRHILQMLDLDWGVYEDLHGYCIAVDVRADALARKGKRARVYAGTSCLDLIIADVDDEKVTFNPWEGGFGSIPVYLIGAIEDAPE